MYLLWLTKTHNNIILKIFINLVINNNKRIIKFRQFHNTLINRFLKMATFRIKKFHYSIIMHSNNLREIILVLNKIKIIWLKLNNSLKNQFKEIALIKIIINKLIKINSPLNNQIFKEYHKLESLNRHLKNNITMWEFSIKITGQPNDFHLG